MEPTPTTPYVRTRLTNGSPKPTSDPSHCQPNPMLLGQNHAEAILRSHLARHGCHVELNTELRGLEQFPDRVVAHVVKMAGGVETAENIACHWLAGADGAHSECF